MLVDGSPAYVATHTTRGKKKRSTRSAETDEADALAYFVQLFKDVDASKVSARPAPRGRTRWLGASVTTGIKC